jgi:hypothetical protein
MYLDATLRRGVILGAITVAAVGAALVVTHHSTSATVGDAPVTTAAPRATTYDAYGQPQNGSAPVTPVNRPIGYANAAPGVVYSASPFGAAQPAPAPVPAPEVAPEPVAPAPVVSRAPAVRRTPYVTHVVYPRRHRRYRRQVVVRRRPWNHSAAIVGGSALAGAGVGALAGGGHGAIVGGLVGGVGGLIYDRKTHKKRRVVVRNY